MCPLIRYQAWHLNWPEFFHFHPHLLWLGRGCHKPSQLGHILLHPPGEGEETDVTGAGSRVSLRAEDVPHPEGRGTSGSRRQHHLGCAREQKQLWSGLGLSDDLPKAACKLQRVFKPFPWSVPTLQPKPRCSLCRVTNPKLNQANSGRNNIQSQNQTRSLDKYLSLSTALGCQGVMHVRVP